MLLFLGHSIRVASPGSIAIIAIAVVRSRRQAINVIRWRREVVIVRLVLRIRICCGRTRTRGIRRKCEISAFASHNSTCEIVTHHQKGLNMNMNVPRHRIRFVLQLEFTQGKRRCQIVVSVKHCRRRIQLNANDTVALVRRHMRRHLQVNKEKFLALDQNKSIQSNPISSNE